MNLKARFYIASFLACAAVLLFVSAINFQPAFAPWSDFLLLTGLAIVAHFFKVEGPSHQLFHATLIFFFAGFLRLPSFLFALLVIIPHLVEWIKEYLAHSQHLRAWYIQPFNISMHIFIAWLVSLVYNQLRSAGPSLNTSTAIFAALVGASLYTLYNHFFVGLVIWLARGVRFQDSGILQLDSLATDYVMLLTGVMLAVGLDISNWFILLAVAPLYLVYRALSVPRLEQQANTDVKTGVWNSRYFLDCTEIEIQRARRTGHNLTLVMADIDLLRNINNCYGHLAGDAVLVGVAGLIASQVRSYDLVARFGGEEFTVLMPDISAKEAFDRVDSIRQQVELAEFDAPTSTEKLKVTMSFGIADLGIQVKDACELIHYADLAVYHAKRLGRNCTQVYSSTATFSSLNETVDTPPTQPVTL